MNDEIISQDELKDIFYGSYPAGTSWDCIDELYIAIHSNAIIYARQQIATIDHFHDLVAIAGQSEGLGPQGLGHMALKAIAEEWLKVQHVCALKESYFVGFHPDVLADDHSYVMECGTTDAGSIPVYLSEPDVRVAGNVSYPFFGDLYITFHEFKRGPEFYIWQTQKVSYLREVFQKSRR